MPSKKQQQDDTPDEAALQAQIDALVTQRIQAQGDAKTALINQIIALRVQLAALQAAGS